jgi:hypothetical protein
MFSLAGAVGNGDDGLQTDNLNSASDVPGCLNSPGKRAIRQPFLKALLTPFEPQD